MEGSHCGWSHTTSRTPNISFLGNWTQYKDSYAFSLLVIRYRIPQRIFCPFKFSYFDASECREALVVNVGQFTNGKQVSDLHTVLTQYLIWRVKEDVEESIHTKEETIMEVALTPIQNIYYKAIYENNTSFLFKSTKPGRAPSLTNAMMDLRQCYNQLFFIHKSDELILADTSASGPQKSVQEKWYIWSKVMFLMETPPWVLTGLQSLQKNLLRPREIWFFWEIF